VPSETLTARLHLRRLRLPAAPRPAWRVLKYPDFRWYFAGSVTSNFGTWIQSTAQVLLAFKLTHSVFAVGAVTAAQFSSSLILGPLAATVASRVGGLRLLIGTQVFSAAVATVMAVIEATGKLTEGPLVIGALLLGLAFTFALPVQTALVPRLVAESETESAMAMNSVSYNSGRALAPAMSVLVIFTIGFGWAFAINAVSFAIYAIMLTATHPRGPARPPRPARVRDGLSVALLEPRIALLLTMVAAVTLADDPVQTASPALVHGMGVSTDWAGFFLSALGCGTILGAFWPAPSWILPKRRQPAGPSVQTSKRAGLSLILLSASIVVFAAGINAWVSFGAALAAGVAALWTGAVTQTQLVRHKPEFTASVVALWAIAWAGTKPLASLTDGLLASHLGVLSAAALLAAPALLLGTAEVLIAGDSKLKVRARQWGGNAHDWLHLPPLKSGIQAG
jgi:MFS family permease